MCGPAPISRTNIQQPGLGHSPTIDTDDEIGDNRGVFVRGERRARACVKINGTRPSGIEAMKSKPSGASIQRISVIVPKNPFVSSELQEKKLCLCALDVAKLMAWWPGKPHEPDLYAERVKA